LGRLTRQEQQRRTRDALLEAALEVFAKFGFHGATVEAITDRAGFTRGAFYSNFDSKEQLFLELFRRRCEQRIVEIREVVAGERAPVEQARAAGRQWDRIVADEPEWVLLLLEFWAFAARNATAREEFASSYLAFRDAVADLIAGQAEAYGLVLPLAAEGLASAMIGLANGIALQRLADPTSVPDGLYEQMLGLFMAGATPAPEREGR
jgi:AcrR family transcriptional regulator